MKPVLISMALAALPGAVQAAGPSFPASTAPEAIAAWAPGATTLQAASIVSIGGGRIVGVVDRRPDPAAPGQVALSIRTEIIDPQAAQVSRALSEAQDLMLDCRARAVKAGPMRLYSDRNLKGRQRTQPGWDEWAPAAPGTVLGRILDAGCPQAAALDPLMAAPLAQPAPVPTPAIAPKSDPPSAPAPQTVPAAPTAGPSEAAPAALPPSAPPATRPGRPGLFVQVAAADSEAAARSVLQGLRNSAGDIVVDHPGSVEPTAVGGRAFYRALLGGFAGVADAKALCKALQARGQDCLIRLR